MYRTNCLITIFFFIYTTSSFSQNLEFKLYSKALRQIEEKNYKAALKSIRTYLKYFSDSPRLVEVLCYRAVVHSEINSFNEAIDDYYTASNLDSLNPDIYKQRGNLYYKLKNNNSALKDFYHCIRLDSAYGEPYALIAKIYSEQGNPDLSCQFFNKALLHGYIDALKNIKNNCDSNSIIVSRYLLKILDIKSKDSDYGYSEFKPIKVGGHSIERIEKYLSLLRDKNGYPILFKHMGTCCPYISKAGAFGKGLCDTFEVIINGDKRILYLSFYEYEQPSVPVGLYSSYHFSE